MVAVAQGEIWWANLPDPRGSEPGFRRPVVVVQCDALNRSRIATIVCIPLTSSLEWAEAPGNAVLTKRETGLVQDSVARAAHIVPVNRVVLARRVGKLGERAMARVLHGVDVVLGR